MSSATMLDAHFHVWQLDRADYGWLTPASGSIYRDVTLDDWRRARASSGVGGGILVQAAPTLAETRFLLALAQSAPDVLGVVGWVDMLAADAPQQIAALAAQPKLRALRPMLQDLADPDWVLQPGLAPAFDAMLRCDLGFDALVKPVHLPRILSLARRYPQLRIVVDHAAKPGIAARQWNGWAGEIEQLAGQAQVFCKLSGLWTEAGAHAAVDVLLPYARHVLTCFGAHRVLWGSDWPVLELAGSYAAWHAGADAAIDATARAQVFGETARRAYRLQGSG